MTRSRAKVCAACNTKVESPAIFCPGCWSLIPGGVQQEIGRARVPDNPRADPDWSMLAVLISKATSIIKNQKERRELADEVRRWKKKPKR